MSAIERVREVLRPFGLEERVIEFEVSTATVELAAEALGCEPGRIAKTLSFMTGERPVLVVAAGDCRVDNRKFKDRFAAKAKMMTAGELFGLTGLRFGGVCPFGLPDTVELYLDESLKAWDPVYPAAGTENSAVRLSLAELEQTARPRGWVDVCRAKEAQTA